MLLLVRLLAILLVERLLLVSLGLLHQGCCVLRLVPAVPPQLHACMQGPLEMQLLWLACA